MSTSTSAAGERFEVETGEGAMTTWVYRPLAGEGPWPAVIFYMDGPGLRDALHAMAQRLAWGGYVVLLPNLYYRAGDQAPFDPATVFSDPSERERLMALALSVTSDAAMRDTAALLRFLDGLPGVEGKAVGCVGYCLGGLVALWAAVAHPDRVAAAASIHGGRLATDAPDSPHAHADQIRGRVYVGVAGLDPNFTAEHTERLRSALDAAGVRATVEIYPDARHGFAVPDLPVYDRESAERHWRRVLELFAEALPG
ncbi:MAG TPA: dienelactone hydrolase family protein [Polyangiaceae bacterium]|nr:dienelactone hydrolase family protein [Polyangiaceae bacterium]